MQGKKIIQEKLFTNFQLSEHVPQDNFYRRLTSILDLQFVRPLTRDYYGSCGQDSIDPEVFFKICLVGYLENIISDRRLISHCSMRLDILLFLGYDIGEPLPWHSTISRTRHLFGETVFEMVFTQVLSQCIASGMVSGHSQVIDSAPVKANASMDSLELKVPAQDLKAHLAEVRHISNRDKETYRKAKNDKADDDGKRITASKSELANIDSRQRKWSKGQNERPGAGNKGSRYTSNKTHYSPVDPDARISVKPGKARKLNYTCQLSVDSSHHVITYVGAYHADKKDNQDLEAIVKKTRRRLWREGLQIENIFADTGYSSGENYAFLERQHLKAYIPPHGTYKGGPEGFRYIKSEDHFICPEGEVVPFKKVFLDHRTKTKKKEYRTSSLQCKGCPLASSCLGKTAKEKKFSVTYYRDEYERTKLRLQTKLGKQSKAIRQSRVEPVFGTLTQYMGLRKVNVRGIQGANKCMLMASVAYNLKKLLKFTKNKSKSKAQRIRFVRFVEKICKDFILAVLSPQKLSVYYT
jgi:transposase